LNNFKIENFSEDEQVVGFECDEEKIFESQITPSFYKAKL
jgi:hypothetical protein